MKYYDSIESIKFDKCLLGEQIYAFDKLDGQNFCVKYSARKKEFSAFASRKQMVDESSEAFGKAVELFKTTIAEPLLEVIKNNSGKKGVFNGAKEIYFYFEYCGTNSFCGIHDPNDILDLILIDIHIYKKGYIQPKDFVNIFKDSLVKIPELIYKGILTSTFVNEVKSGVYSLKEGVICSRSTSLPGQRLPKVKIKTQEWLNKLKKTYPSNWEELE